MAKAQDAGSLVDDATAALTAVHSLTVGLAHAQAPPDVLKSLSGCSAVLTAVLKALHSAAGGGSQPDPNAAPADAGPPAAAAPPQAGPSTPSSRDQAMAAASQHLVAAHAAANQAASAPPQ